MTPLFLTILSLILPSQTLSKPDAPHQETYRLETYRGEVVMLTELPSLKNLVFDKEPVLKQVVLLQADGSFLPLLSDDASRALFIDKRVRNKKAELVARKHKGMPYLQVVSFKIESEGKLQTPEYYCEVCAISVRFPQDCPCCQGELIFRMKPETH